MAAKTMTPYTRAQPPEDIESYKRFMEEELRKLEKSLRETEAAVVEIQAKAVSNGWVFP